MPTVDVVELSRLQFAATALYHFLFVPLTLGLSWILVIMESVYVMTGKEIYRDMTRFWGKLFGINFVMGVATGITLEFQFGTNWAYYSHYVGDIFGAPLAIEGLMAFFLESTFVGMFFFGWNRLGKVHAPARHVPGRARLESVGAVDPDCQRLDAEPGRRRIQPRDDADGAHELRRPASSIRSPGRSSCTRVAAGYVAASLFVLGISSWYLLRGRDPSFAMRSFAVAAGFGLASALSVIVLGDESGYTTGEVQKVKLAVIEAEWETEKPPASFTVFGFPDQEGEVTRFAIEDPLDDGTDRHAVDRHAGHRHQGPQEASTRRESARVCQAYAALQRIKGGDDSAEARAAFDSAEGGPGLRAAAASKYTRNVVDATPEQIRAGDRRHDPERRADVLVVPDHGRVWACGSCSCSRRRSTCWRGAVSPHNRWLMHVALWSIPLPWVAMELGWIVAEYGRQPWAISEVLPTHLGVSSVTAGTVMVRARPASSLFYTGLLVVEVYLMLKYIRLGPASLGTGRYQSEKPGQRPVEGAA